MSKTASNKNPLQTAIMTVLYGQEFARFRDLRPKATDTNLVTYHLKSLIKAGLVKKTGNLYTLSAKGLAHADQHYFQDGEDVQPPKQVIMLLIQNSDGDVLLQRRTVQPFIGRWSLPQALLSVHDESVVNAGRRVALSVLGLPSQAVVHGGIALVRVMDDEQLITSELVHICTFNRDDIVMNDDLQWARPHKLSQLHLAPAVEEIVARGFFRDPFFFEEYTVQWNDALAGQASA